MTLTMSYSRRTVRTVVAVAALGLALPCMSVRAATPRWLAVNAKQHAVTLTIIAGYTNALGGFNFNGYGDGKMVVSVPVGYRVTVLFRNKVATPHSLVVTPYSEKDSTSGYPLAFKGSGSANPTSGLTMGRTQRFSFVASKTGKYALVCAVPGHEVAGMWDVFVVTRGGKASITY